MPTEKKMDKWDNHAKGSIFALDNVKKPSKSARLPHFSSIDKIKSEAIFERLPHLNVELTDSYQRVLGFSSPSALSIALARQK